MRDPRRESGFTLIELMIVIGIISALAAIAIPNLIDARRVAQERKAMMTVRAIFDAQQIYRKKMGLYANNLGQLYGQGLLKTPFTSSTGIQRVGGWEYYTAVPVPSTPAGQTFARNAPNVFRVACQPAGANINERLRHGDQMYILLADGRLFTHHRYGPVICQFGHLVATCATDADSEFGGYYFPSDGQ